MTPVWYSNFPKDEKIEVHVLIFKKIIVYIDNNTVFFSINIIDYFRPLFECLFSRTFFLSYSKFNACIFFCQINYATKLSFILPPKDKIIDGATETEEGPNTLNYIFMLHFPENWGEGAVVMSGMQQGGRQGGQPPPPRFWQIS